MISVITNYLTCYYMQNHKQCSLAAGWVWLRRLLWTV